MEIEYLFEYKFISYLHSFQNIVKGKAWPNILGFNRLISRDSQDQEFEPIDIHMSHKLFSNCRERVVGWAKFIGDFDSPACCSLLIFIPNNCVTSLGIIGTQVVLHSHLLQLSKCEEHNRFELIRRRVFIMSLFFSVFQIPEPATTAIRAQPDPQQKT